MTGWRGVGNREVLHALKKKGAARGPRKIVGKHGFPREREPKASVGHEPKYAATIRSVSFESAGVSVIRSSPFDST
jgi:hypothetical protein